MKTRVLLVALSLSLTGVTSCSSDEATKAESATCPGGEIRFGIEPYEDPTKLEPAYRVLAEALSKNLDCPVKIQVVEDYSAEVLAMKNDRLDLGQFGPLGYVFASQKAGAEPLVSFATASGELSTYTAGLWVPKDSDITSVADLKGRSLALGSVGSTSGDALPRLALKDAGLGEGDLDASYAGGHSEALLALVHGTVDAAEINSQTLATAVREGTLKESDFREIWTSEPIPNDPITVRGDLPEEFKDSVRQALLDLDPASVGKVGAFLDVTPPGGLMEVTKDTYEPLFVLADELGLTEDDV